MRAPSHTAVPGFLLPLPPPAQAETLNNVLAKDHIETMRSHFGLPSPAIKARVEVAATLPPEPEPKKFAKKGMDTEFIQSGFVQVVPKKSSDAPKIARELNKKGPVWKVFVAPRPVPAAVLNGSQSGSRNFEPSQGYLHSAPNGIGAMEVWSLSGAKGSGITICDIEGNWNRTHEDLPSGISLIGGTVIDELGWRNHGTAVLGEMISIPDVRGTVGISHSAKAVVHPAIVSGVFNTAAAIANATAFLKAGDVILIELQATGPNGKYVAMQFWGDIFSAIAAATAKGITVVEAAGNGDENFDLAVFNDTGLQKDSGAVVVGAGVRRPTISITTAAMRRSACPARASGSRTTARSSTCRRGAGTSLRSAMETRKEARRRTPGTRCDSPAPRVRRRSSPERWPAFRDVRSRRMARR